MISPYDNIPNVLIERLDIEYPPQDSEAYCVGFELKKWRSAAYADHLIEWLPDYALKSDELETLTHANTYSRIRQAAARIYTSENYKNRGEIGEISLHAICRQYFDTIPVAPRVFYLTSSNEVVKSFDMVHVRYLGDSDFELWLGEAKFFTDSNSAISSAISSVTDHISAGFLKNEKLILGPQVSKNIPHSDKIRELLSSEASLDKLIKHSVFPIFIVANSKALTHHTEPSPEYNSAIQSELTKLADTIEKSGLKNSIVIRLIYLPILSKKDLADDFDLRLKGLNP